MNEYIVQQSQREKRFFDNRYASYEVYEVPPLDMHDYRPRLFPKDLTDKRVCIVASIVDWYPIAFTRMGASVTGFDISTSAVEFAYRLAEFNGVSGLCFEEKDIYELDYPDDSFDIVYAASVLHHLPDLELAGKALYRITAPGGMAVFDENSLRNPLLKIARSLIFRPSQHGGRVRYGRLGFQRLGTEDENPLSEDQVWILKTVSGNLERYYPNYCFFRLLSGFGPPWLRTERFKRLFAWSDQFIGRRIPFLHWTSALQTLVMRKYASGSK